MIIPLLFCLLLCAFPGAFAQEAQPGKSEEDNGYAQISIFAKALELIRQDYVDDNKTSYHDLVTAAMKGMLSSLDPHSQFMDPNDFRDMQDDTRSRFNGLGIEVPGCDQCFARTRRRESDPYAAATCNQGDQGVRVAKGRDQNPKCEGSKFARRRADGAIQDWLCPVDSV